MFRPTVLLNPRVVEDLEDSFGFLGIRYQTFEPHGEQVSTCVNLIVVGHALKSSTRPAKPPDSKLVINVESALCSNPVNNTRFDQS